MGRLWSMVLGIGLYACFALGGSSAHAWELTDLDVAFTWKYEWYNQRGHDGFFGPYNVDNGPGTTTNLNFWNGAQFDTDIITRADAYGFPWLQNDDGHPVADYSGVTFPLESATIGTVATRDGKILVIAASDADSEDQNKHGHNHDRKAKSKYDLRDIDGKRRGDSHGHLHQHGDNQDNKPKSKYDLRDLNGKRGGIVDKHGHDNKDAHVHDHGHDHKDAHAHDHVHKHHHAGEAHHDDHGDDHHHHHHGEAEGHDHGHAGHEHGHGHDDGDGHNHDEGEGGYDRLWDCACCG